MNPANQCIEQLLQDLKKIESESISKKDYKTAAEQWGTALLQRQYYGLKNQIEELHCGPSFAVAVELLKENLEKEKTNSLKLNMQMVRAYGAQTRLPWGD